MKNLNQYLLHLLMFAGVFPSFGAAAQTPLSISGPITVCVGDVPSYFVTPAQPGANYAWSVTAQGNVLNEGGVGTLQWIATGVATITVQELDVNDNTIAQGTLDVSVSPMPYPQITALSSVACTAIDTIHRGGMVFHLESNSCLKACENSTVTYSVENVPGAVYNWDVIGDASHNASGNTLTVNWGVAGWGLVTVQEISGSCAGTDSLCVEILEAPEALFETQPEVSPLTKFCLNSSILFFDQSTGTDESPIVSWVWDFGDGNYLSVGPGSSGNPVEHSYNHPGSYDVILTVTNACGCVDVQSLTIEVGDMEGVKIECPGVTCETESMTYRVENVTCSQAYWSASGGNLFYQDPETAQVKWDDVDEYGFGYLTYHNECGACPETNTVKVPVIQESGTIQGPANICANKKYLYSMPQWPSTEFDWDITPGIMMVPTDQPNVVAVYGTGGISNFTIGVRYCNTLLDCSGTAELTVNVSHEEFIDGAAELCIGASDTYGLTFASSANWTLTPPTGSPVYYNHEATISPTFNQAGTYTLEIEGDFCSPEPFYITVYPEPAAPLALDGPESACEGIPIQYGASPQIPGTTFLWSVNTGSVSPAMGSNTHITFDELPATVSVVRVTDDGLQCSSDPLTFEVDDAMPSVNISTDAPQDLTVCGSTQWAFETDYAGGDLYQWKILDPMMGSIVSGNHTPEIEVLFNNPPGGSTYVAVIVAVTKCLDTRHDTLVMEVINAPNYSVTPSQLTVCANESVNFTITPTPTEYSELTWAFGDGTTSNTANATHTYSSTGSVAQYHPVATIVHPEGCPSTAILPAGPISVKPAPTALVTPGSLLDCGPFSTALSATVTTGFGSTTNFEWHGPAGSSPPDCPTCDTWNIDQYGTYYVVVENSNGCEAVSNEVEVEEKCDSCEGPKPLLIASDSTFLDCGIVQANIAYDPNGLNIIGEEWIFPPNATDTDYTLGTDATASASFEEAGLYTFGYKVLYGDGTCAILFTQQVYVPFIGDMRYTASCGTGNAYTVTLFDHSNVFPSEVGNINRQYAYREGSGPWQIITADLDAFQVTVDLPPGDYQLAEWIWLDPPSGAPTCTTKVELNLPEKPVADFDIDAAFMPACVNDVAIHFENLSTPAEGLQFLWDFGDFSTNYQSDPDKVYGSSPGLGSDFEITLTATNALGCTDASEGSVGIVDNGYWDGVIKPTLLSNPSPPQCIGTPITLSYFHLAYSVPPSFTWYQGGTQLTPPVSSSIFDATQPGGYWVMGSDANGCLVPSAPTAVDFTQIPIPTILGDPFQCDSVGFNLTNSLSGEPGMTFQWERSPGGILGNTPNINQVLTTGTYEYTLTVSQGGCSAVSAPFTVTVGEPVDEPAVSFAMLSCEPYVAQLSATHSASGTFNWSNGGVGAVTTVGLGGAQSVIFTADNGCQSEAFLDVPKSAQEYLWIFPYGCFCDDDLGSGDKRCSRHGGGPYIAGPIIPFPKWSYLLNGMNDLSGLHTVPDPFYHVVPDQINLILYNGYCNSVSEDMYYGHNCPHFGPEGMERLGDGNEKRGDTVECGENAGAPALTLTPNPAGDRVWIHYRYGETDGGMAIAVYDLSGRKVKVLTPEHRSGEIALPLHDFKAGIYEVCLTQDGTVIARSKLSVAP